MMSDAGFVTVNGRKLRKGYTTGSCAAGASKAAAFMLFSGRFADSIQIDTPAGIRLTLPVTDSRFTGETVICSVVKDGGDDPDMTTGLKVFAEAKVGPRGSGIKVSASEGIGIVTLPGLKVEVGNPAINPVPMEMILKEVREVLPEGQDVEIVLSIPGGEETARKTYNPKLGIMGGLSILGTSGIVTPMSEEAWKEAVAVELGVVRARGFLDIVYAFGNYGESFAVNDMGIGSDRIIKISNFLGYMLDKAMEMEIRQILLIGHLGKLVKVAAGIFQTHSRVADARMEILTAYAALEGAGKELLEKIYSCRTTEAAAALIKENGLQAVFERIAENTSKRCKEYTYGKIRIGTVLFNEENTLLSHDLNALDMVKSMGGYFK